MPSFGYFLGSRFEHLLNSVGPWVAFILLAVIGVNMVRESFGGDETVDNDFSAKAMLPLAIATSIDAFAVGVSFAAMQVDILPAAGLIGVTTCLLSAIGVKVGAMFGDNLSFISDTTIAACNGQGCAMRDKFKGNFWIALPAAIATLVLILLLTMGHDTAPIDESYDLVQIIPYVLVLAGGVAGINVFIVLLTGIVSGAVIMLLTGQVEATALLASMGNGAAGMFETSMVAILVAAMCALIRVYGGFDALLCFIRTVFRGKKGGQLGMGLLVGAMDIATANNTVAIVMANPIAKEMSEDYGISPSRTACLLDTFSCIFQGIIPYGAQMLVAISAAAEMGFALSAFSIMRYLFYPYLLLVSSLVAIFLVKGKKN